VTFVGYFYPIRELVPDIFTLNVTNAWAGFWIGFFTLATYLNAGWLREKVCLYMCPYARFQSVMFSPETRTVTYDFGANQEVPAKRTRTARNLEWATASTAGSASRSAQPASISAMGCSTSASTADCASMPVTK